MNFLKNSHHPSAGAPPPPPPPPPPTLLSATPVIQKSAPRSAPIVEPARPNPRDELLNSIKDFQGLKSLKAASCNAHESSSADVAATAAPAENSILDQLKNELVKRAQFFSKHLFVLGSMSIT